MFHSSIHNPTPGEKLVNNLLRELPKKQFFFHFEPQIVTTDGRTSKPDFIIISALLGVVIVEVKDWFRILSGNQQNIQIMRNDGITMVQHNPIRVAERYAYDLKRRFEERAELWELYKGKKCLRFPWQCMVVLPNISQQTIYQFEHKGIWPHRTVIGSEALIGPTHIQQAIENLPWKFQLEHPMSLDILDIIRELIDPSLQVEDSEGQTAGTLTQAQYNLITEPLSSMMPKQLELFGDDETETEPSDNTENRMVRLVRGVAGSGKTLILVRRAKHIAQQHPDAKILVMTFNVDIANDLRRRIEVSDNQVEVMNFHRVCRLILKSVWRDPISSKDWLRKHEADTLKHLGLPIEFVASEIAWRKEVGLYDSADYLIADRKRRGRGLERTKRELINGIFNRYTTYQSLQREKDESWYDWDDVSFAALEALENHPMSGTYDVILIDEAQDFAPSWIRVTKALLHPEGSLLLCDDPAQSIFCSYTWQQKGLSVVGRSKVLRVPFRSTREISQAAHSLIEADDNLRHMDERLKPDFTSYELGRGPLPALVACKDAASEVRFVDDKIHELLGAGTKPDQIAILCHNRWHMKWWEAWRQQGIYVQYFEKMKGLEFSAVLIPHLQDAFPLPNDPASVSAIRRKIFTAMTRARYRLNLSYHGTLLPKPLEPLLNYMWCESYVG